TEHKPIFHYQHFDISLDQQTLITDIAETIIPKTSTPGATDLNLYAFIIKMLDDCTAKKDQQAFLKGMGEFNDAPKKLFNKSFSGCSKKEKEDALRSFEKKDNGYSKDMLAFYHTVKGLTVFGYTESKYFMTKQVVYELVPGRYKAYYPVKNLKAGTKNG
ncbi:MAG: gluconate 2-dehydrogenase subunit 3 family protein, partial [Mucilaginibacter sp.]|nr:gluconate 2-dehydrogenase subunit 3 family protein [Mucilaginibacter sp.]